MALDPTGGPAAYTSPSSVIEIVERFRESGLRTPFDIGVLIQAGISEGLAPRTLQSLRELDLIDDAGNPTDTLVALQRSTSEEFKERFAEVVQTAYAPIFQMVNPETNPMGVRDAFRPYTPVGQQGRMVTLFMGLCAYAGIVEKAAVPEKRAADPRRPGGRPPTATRPAPASRKNRGGQQQADTGAIPETLMALMKEALPMSGRSWTTNQRERFIRTFEAILDFKFPVDDNPPDERDHEDNERG